MWLADVAGRLFQTSARSVEENVYVSTPDDDEPEAEPERTSNRMALRAFVDAEDAYEYGRSTEAPAWPLSPPMRLL